MNDEYTGEDFDTMVRLQCLELVNEMANRAAMMGNYIICDPECLVEAAALVEHYASDGLTVAFNLGQQDLRKCVSGSK